MAKSLGEGINREARGVRRNFFLTSKPDNDIAAWIAIGVSNGKFADPGKLRLAILDVYGERDFALVLQNADARADHYFAGNEGTLIKHVKQFLEQRIK